MRRIILLSLAFIITDAYSQRCTYEGYAYGVRSSDDQIEYRCIPDPNSTTENIMKASTPFGVCTVQDIWWYYDSRIEKYEWVYDYGVCSDARGEVRSKIWDAINNAVTTWNSVCPENLFEMKARDVAHCSYDNVVGIIPYVNQGFWDAQRVKNNGIHAIGVTERNNANDVQPWIALNISSDFILRGGVEGLGAAWSFNCVYNPILKKEVCDGCVADCPDCIDFESVILHELGHVLGLGHPKETCGLNNDDIVMNPYKQKRHELSEYDRCAICKLYCPANCENIGTVQPVGVELDLDIYPNPTGSAVHVLCRNEQSGDLRMNIYSIDGTLIGEQRLSGYIEYLIDVSSLSPGSYYFVLYSDKAITSKLISIIRR